MNYAVRGVGGGHQGLLPEYTSIVGAWVLDQIRSVYLYEPPCCAKLTLAVSVV